MGMDDPASRQAVATSSSPVLAGMVVLFLALFFGVRSCSGFRAVESELDPLTGLAQEQGMSVATVLALREQAQDLDEAGFAARVAEFGRLRGDLGDPLAVMAIASGAPLQRLHDLVASAGGDRQAAWLAVCSEPQALPGRRFLQMRDRFAQRDSGRTRD